MQRRKGEKRREEEGEKAVEKGGEKEGENEGEKGEEKEGEQEGEEEGEKEGEMEGEKGEEKEGEKRREKEGEEEGEKEGEKGEEKEGEKEGKKEGEKEREKRVILHIFRFLNYTTTYEPPEDLQKQVSSIFLETLPSGTEKPSMQPPESLVPTNPTDQFKTLLNVEQKSRILAQLETKLGLRVPNSVLHQLTTGDQIVRFFGQARDGLVSYNKMARSEGTVPPNVHIAEESNRFET